MRVVESRSRLLPAHVASVCVHVVAFALVAAARVDHAPPRPPPRASSRLPDHVGPSIEIDLVAPAVASRRTAAPAPPGAAPPSPARNHVAPAARVAAHGTTTVTAPAPAPGSTETSSAPAATELPNGAELLRALPGDVMRAGSGDMARAGSGSPDEAAGIRERLGSYFREGNNRERHELVAGSGAYYRPMRQTIEREWRPRSARSVSVAEGIVGSLFTGPEGFRRVNEAMEGTLAPTRRSAAAAALDSAHPNSPMLSNPPHAAARAEATARTTRAVLEVDQDAASRIVAVRVVEGSGIPLFDASAVAAVERAVGLLPPHAMPGGWRSRWLFEVTRTRTPPPVGLLPSLPDEGPRFGAAVGGTFDESTGSVQASVPFALNERRHVQLLWSRAMAADGDARDGGA